MLCFVIQNDRRHSRAAGIHVRGNQLRDFLYQQFWAMHDVYVISCHWSYSKRCCCICRISNCSKMWIYELVTCLFKFHDAPVTQNCVQIIDVVIRLPDRSDPISRSCQQFIASFKPIDLYTRQILQLLTQATAEKFHKYDQSIDMA
jgi:hypothetical protein